MEKSFISPLRSFSIFETKREKLGVRKRLHPLTAKIEVESLVKTVKGMLPKSNERYFIGNEYFYG